ncbi:unnamed protein product [Rotaria sp. Silwood2]|nr:unnamed protein product [Rotaria sp. Silwood2]CAF4512905.1 unnamed protein product [Rotaria sp. Silwood2]
MGMIKAKKNILRRWTFESTSTTGPALSDYLESTKNRSFGAFKVNLGDRKKILNSCREHISRLLEELARRFQPSVIQENLSMLFDPHSRCQQLARKAFESWNDRDHNRPL